VVVLGRVGTHPRCDGTKLKVFLCFPGFIHRRSVRLPTGSLDEWRKGTCNWETSEQRAMSSRLGAFCE
jgi:hypothetical protein